MARRKGSNKLRAQLFNALSDPERLKVLEALLGPVREGRVGEIAKAAGMKYEEALSHLGALRKGQLVTVRHVGAYGYYRACDVSCADKILASVDEMLMKIEEMRRRGILV